MQNQILPHVEYDRKKELHHCTQIYCVKDEGRKTRNQEVSKEKKPGHATQRLKRGIPNITYSNAHNGEKQLLIHTGENFHVCDVCNKGFTQKCHLKIHYLIHTGEKPHKCEVCHKTFTRKHVLQNHNLTHTGEKPHECEVCHIAFTQKQDLLRHNLTHTGEKPHKCEVCHKTFTRKHVLQNHNLTHTGEKPHECEVCHRGFTRKSDLKTHSLIHTGEKPNECEVCHKFFTRKHDLLRHNLTHSGEKPYECEVCHKGFKQKRYLQTHYLIHTNDQLHPCDICNRGFSNKRYLSRHIAIHMSQKQLMCSVCCTVFSRNIRLKKHIMAQHGEKDDICRKCNKGISQKNILRSVKMHSVDQVGKQKSLKELKNTEEVKDRDKVKILDSALKASLNEISEAIVDQEQRIHVDPQFIPFSKESDNYKPADNGSHRQALFNTFPIIDQQINTTLQHQHMYNIGPSTMYPFAGDQNIPKSIDIVDESLADIEAYFQENDPEAEVDRRGQDEEKWQQLNQLLTVPVSIQEAPGPRVDQYQQEVHVDQQDFCIPIESDNGEIAFLEENDYQQPLIHTEPQISMKSNQEFSTINLSAIQLSFPYSS